MTVFQERHPTHFLRFERF